MILWRGLNRGPRKGSKVVKQVSLLPFGGPQIFKGDLHYRANSIQMYLSKRVGPLNSSKLFFIFHRTSWSFKGSQGRNPHHGMINDRLDHGQRRVSESHQRSNSSSSLTEIMPREVSSFDRSPAKDVSNLYLSHIRLTIRKTHCN